MLQTYILYTTTFHLKIMANKIYLKIFYYLIAFINISLIYFNENGDEKHPRFMYLIFLAGFSSYFFFYFIYFLLIKGNFKEWTMHFFKGGFITVSYFLNFAFLRYFSGLFRGIFKENFNESNPENFSHILLMIHSTLLGFLFHKFLWFYYELFIKEIIIKLK